MPSGRRTSIIIVNTVMMSVGAYKTILSECAERGQ
jgi:hypothetical protein